MAGVWRGEVSVSVEGRRCRPGVDDGPKVTVLREGKRETRCDRTYKQGVALVRVRVEAWTRKTRETDLIRLGSLDVPSKGKWSTRPPSP